MTKTAAQLLDDARSLSEEDRAELAFHLLDTLEPPRNPRTDEEWLREIERRAERALAGEPGVSWEEARKELEETLRAL